MVESQTSGVCKKNNYDLVLAPLKKNKAASQPNQDVDWGFITLGAHVQRGLQHLVVLSVCLSV